MDGLSIRRTIVVGFALWVLIIVGVLQLSKWAFGQEAPQQQQVACMANYGAMKAKLEDGFGEVPTNMALSGQSGMTLFVSPGGATFTLTATRVDGRTCIVVAGKDWAELAAPIIGDPT